ncbi:MAG: hypothetical protein R2861_10055 [Desulfobacterales bacterium]
MDPTEGYGLDLIFQRRVWEDVTVMVDFSHYDFDNYVVWADSGLIISRMHPGAAAWWDWKMSARTALKWKSTVI